ncbi:MAG TPA: hypothetical protein PKA05_12845 [Roseiflexaceae bacterium]|nr:hypothetical protein [Roseiflexaceae bacterium]
MQQEIGNAMTSVGTPSRYRSYLLRFWEERGHTREQVAWRFSLENPLTGERHGFVTLEALMQFLQAELVPVDDELSGDTTVTPA